MPGSDLLAENNVTARRLSETLGAVNMIREVFAIDIRNLESLSEGDRSPIRAPVSAASPLYERGYERLLRLRRIHAKLGARERLLKEACTSIDDPTGRATRQTEAASSDTSFRIRRPV
jgi:hypothetical protein